MAYVKLVGTSNPNTNWTAEVVLEVNDDGEPTKVVRAGEPVDLTDAEKKNLEAQGFVFEKSSKDEAEKADEEDAQVGADSAESGPVLGSSGDADKSKSGK